jgi:hypothetical protein
MNSLFSSFVFKPLFIYDFFANETEYMYHICLKLQDFLGVSTDIIQKLAHLEYDQITFDLFTNFS